MKGIIFTEFLELVETNFGMEMVDDIISSSDLESQGIYTSVGTYSFSEMLQLLTHLSAKTGISKDNLMLVYGEHLFGVLKYSYPGLIESYKDPLDLLSSIENHIHVEVKKIYPDAELPSFELVERTANKLVMIYRSSRAMHHFGLGLMKETFKHFKTKASIDLEKIKEDGTEVKFSIIKDE